VESLLRYLGDSMDLPLFTWSLNGGLCRVDLGKPAYQSGDPKTALDHVLSSRFAALYHFEGLGPFLEDRVVASKFIDTVRCFTEHRGAIIVTGTDFSIPEALKAHSAVVAFPTPGPEEFRELLNGVFRDLGRRTEPRIAMSEKDMNRLLGNLQGLTLTEAEKILTKAIIEDGRLDADDISLVIVEKKAIVEREGLLEFTPADRDMHDIADLASLKSWLAKRKGIITDPEGAAQAGLTFPKGILLLGVPGSGKSLCAKAVAAEWGLPLIKMDPSRLYNKYVGESEKNFRRAMEAAERLSPVVLWIDESQRLCRRYRQRYQQTPAGGPEERAFRRNILRGSPRCGNQSADIPDTSGAEETGSGRIRPPGPGGGHGRIHRSGDRAGGRLRALHFILIGVTALQ